MQHTPPGRVVRTTMAWLAALSTFAMVLVTAPASTVLADPPTPTTDWHASGPGVVTSGLDANDVPTMSYSVPTNDPGNTRFADQTWTFETVADEEGTVEIPWTYTGFHAYFGVTVHLDAFVVGEGGVTTTPLLHLGPVNCCTKPSSGFTYSGTTSLHVEEGEPYGFRLGGLNFDSNPDFHGTFTLALPATTPPPPAVPFTDPATLVDNTSWSTAELLTSATPLHETLLQPGEARWYKFPVTPNSQVQVDLDQLDQNFDLTMYRDIGQTFTTLTSNTDLARLGAQFAADAYSPSIYSPSIYSPSIYSPSIYSPSIYSPSIYSPSIYSPSIYSPSIYSPADLAFLDAFTSAQTRSLIAVSAREGASAESIRTATWNNTGYFYVRVAGRNGASSPTPFRISLTGFGGPCNGLTISVPSGPNSVPGLAADKTAIILTDTSRFVGGVDADYTATMERLATATNGVVVDLASNATVQAMHTQADAHVGCAYLQNLVAQSIRDVVNSYRATNPQLQYVVIAGGDTVIPFFRYADAAGIGPESDYIPPLADNTASESSLRNNFVLGQDAYGSLVDLPLKGTVIPLPDLAVGRLVESSTQIEGMIAAYLGLSNGVLPTPSSSLVTGYDFLTSAADAVQANFAAGLGADGRADTLITDQGVPTDRTTVGTPDRQHSWTATDLAAALFGSRHDLLFLAGHFSANSTLAADYSTSLITTALAAHPDALKNTLVISPGCHSGFNIQDNDGIPTLTLGLDWAEAMANQRATLIAGTGYQYADTDFLAYSAKLYADLTQELLVGRPGQAVSVGQALMNAKRTYLQENASPSGIDQKSLIQATLYGLPMLGIDLQFGRIPATVPSAGGVPTHPVLAGTPGAVLGLTTADHEVAPRLTDNTRPVLDLNGQPTGARFHWWSGTDGVQTGAGLPALPKQIDDVTSENDEVLRGVGFFGGTYTDASGVTPLTGAPTTEQNGIHTDFTSPVFFPQKLATINYFGELSGGGDGRTRLITTPTQYRSDGAGTTTERTYSDLQLRLFYSHNTQTYGVSTPALAAPPSISGVSGTVAPGGRSVVVSAHVTGDLSAGIQEVWVTYTGERGALHGSWQSVELTQDTTDSTLWSGSFELPAGQEPGAVRYIVQAANGVGLVGFDNNLGDGYTPDVPVGTTPPAATPTTLAFDAGQAVAGPVGTTVSVGATLTAAPAGSPVTFSLGSVSAVGVTDATGHASVTLALQDAVGGYTLAASFTGGAGFGGSSTITPFTIQKAPTSLALATASVAKVSTGVATGVSVTLTRGGAAVPQQTVFFTVTGGPSSVQLESVATTDPSGRASLGILPLANGTYSVQAAFTGTSTLAAAPSATTSLTVNVAAPTIVASALPAPNAAGWNRTDVIVSFSCSDTVGAPSCSAPQTVATDGTTTVTGSSTDFLGNASSASATVKRDTASPTITGAPATAPNAAGWYRTAVSVAFTCGDALSGVASCSPAVLLTGEGTQSAGGTAKDNADNTAATTVSGIRIDRTAPTVAITGVRQGAIYAYGKVPVAGCTTTDALSGVATPATVTSIRTGPVVTVTCAGAVDVAGNTSPVVQAVYRISGICIAISILVRVYVLLSKSPKASSVITLLLNDLQTGKYDKFVKDVLAQRGVTLTKAQADDLASWATGLSGACT